MIVIGHARNPSGQVVVVEGDRGAERVWIIPSSLDGLCMCERARARGFGMMCLICSGPSRDFLFHHTSGDL